MQSRCYHMPSMVQKRSSSLEQSKGQSAEMKAVDLMRRDWDERARENAFHYIASWRKDWTAESFFESGEEDYSSIVAPVLGQRSFEPSGNTVLELGCGAGRMTRAFAVRFGQVIAVDISAEMLTHAKELLPEASNVVWTLGDGVGLREVPDRSIDFAFSYIVLQHLPTREHTLKYIRELLRVLSPGGVFLFQFNGLRRPNMNWRGRFVWGAVDLLWSIGLNRASRALAALFRLDPSMAGRSWRGAALEAHIVESVVRASGGTVESMTGQGTPMAWCAGTKRGAQ